MSSARPADRPDRPARRPGSLADRARYAAWPLVSIAVITVFALLRIANLAIPVAPDVVCPAIFPPDPGCAGYARTEPALFWGGLILLAAAATVAATLSGRLRKQLSWVGVAVTGIRQVEYL